MFEDDAATPFVSFDRFETKIRLRELFRSRLWVKCASLSGLQVNVEQNKDWSNFSSLREHFASDKPEDDSSDFGLIFNDVRIERSTIRYADLALGSEFLLRDIALHIPTIDFSDLKTDVGLDLNLAENATLHTDLRLSDNAKQYAVNMKLDHLGIEVIEPYLQQYCPVDMLSGYANLDVEVQGLTEHLLDFDLTGSFALNDIALQDTESHPLATLDSVFDEISRFQLNDKTLSIEELYLSGLNAAYIVQADGTTNFDLFWNRSFGMDSTDMEQDHDAVSVENEKDKSWEISIADLNLDKAEVFYEDHTLPQVFHYEVSDIGLTSKHFSNEGNNAVQLQAVLNKVGKLHLNWQGSFGGRDNHNLTLMLSNVKVADFSPYAVQMFGVPLENGTLSFRSQNIISESNLNGINKLQIGGFIRNWRRFRSSWACICSATNTITSASTFPFRAISTTLVSHTAKRWPKCFPTS